MCFDGFDIIVPGMGKGVGVFCVCGVNYCISSMSLFLLIDTSLSYFSHSFKIKNWNLEETVGTNIENLESKGNIKVFGLFFAWIREKKEKGMYSHLIY